MPAVKGVETQILREAVSPVRALKPPVMNVSTPPLAANFTQMATRPAGHHADLPAHGRMIPPGKIFGAAPSTRCAGAGASSARVEILASVLNPRNWPLSKKNGWSLRKPSAAQSCALFPSWRWASSEQMGTVNREIVFDEQPAAIRGVSRSPGDACRTRKARDARPTNPPAPQPPCESWRGWRPPWRQCAWDGAVVFDLQAVHRAVVILNAPSVQTAVTIADQGGKCCFSHAVRQAKSA